MITRSWRVERSEWKLLLIWTALRRGEPENSDNKPLHNYGVQKICVTTALPYWPNTFPARPKKICLYIDVHQLVLQLQLSDLIFFVKSYFTS